jgi:5-methylcytosine-specific restriction endonuclease McrA
MDNAKSLGKTCSNCGEFLPWDAFHASRNRPDGKHSWCKTCKNRGTQSWREKHPDRQYDACRSWDLANPAKKRQHRLKYAASHREQESDRARRWYESNPARAKENARKYRARKKGASIGHVDLEFILSRDGSWCYLCKGLIDPDLTYPHAGSLTFDHVVPLSRGGDHSTENLRVAHAGCNRSKGARLLEELE